MSHDRGCHCGREKYEYDECSDTNCANKKSGRMKCVVHGCTNHSDEGVFVMFGNMCKPCHTMITTGVIKHTNSFIGDLDKKIRTMALDSLTVEGQLNAEIERLKEKCDKQANILRQLTPERIPGIKFIHAEVGTKDLNGMPEYLIMVPSYGSDVTYIYERKDVEK